MHSRTLALATAVAALTVAGAAQATITLDQSQTQFNEGTPFTFPTGQFNNFPVGQSFTAGESGYLADILVQSNGPPSGDPTYAIQVLSGDGPGGTVLGAEHVLASVNSQTAWETLDLFSLGIQLTAGQQYTFYFDSVIGGGDTSLRGLLADDKNLYAGGRIYLGPAYGNKPSWDLTFQTLVSNVGPTGVPEPAAWALMVTGFGGLGAVLRRRRARPALA